MRNRTRTWRQSRIVARLTTVLFYCVFQLAIFGTVASKIDGGWDTQPNTQYHIQTDEGPERYFKYQTISGQYRKERRLQDGSVVGTYGWVDADGYLRLNDYVADSKGYRIVKNKKLFVGAQAPVGQAVSAAKYAPAVAGTSVSASPLPSPSPPTPYDHHREEAVTRAPPSRPQHSSWRGSPFVYPSDSQSSPLLFPSSSTASPERAATSSHYRRPQPISAADAAGGSTSHYRRPQPISAAAASHYRRPQPISAADASTASPPTTAAADYYSVRPVDVNSIAATADGEVEIPYRRRSSSSTAEQPLYEQPLRPHTFRPAYRKVVDLASETATAEAQYDGVSFVRNGFKYYLPRHYHEEQSDASGDTRAGSFGYVDPFGIRRVVYYNASPGTGFVHRKNNRYVGLDAEPYDPRPQ